jgi:hypothetical protein
MQKTEEVKSHLKGHQKYPANKEELIAGCNNLSDFSEEDKKEFAANLPDGTYNNAEEVSKALGL